MGPWGCGRRGGRHAGQGGSDMVHAHVVELTFHSIVYSGMQEVAD